MIIPQIQQNLAGFVQRNKKQVNAMIVELKENGCFGAGPPQEISISYRESSLCSQ